MSTYEQFFEEQRRAFEHRVVGAANYWALCRNATAQIRVTQDGFVVDGTHLTEEGKIGNTPAPNVFEAQRLLVNAVVPEVWAVDQELKKIAARRP